MTQDPSDKINSYISAANGALPILSSKHGREIGSNELQDALCRALGIDELDGVHLLDHDLTADRMLELLDDFDFTPVEVLHTIEMPEEDGIIPDGTMVMVTEKLVRIKGEIWEIHRYDADPWPSNPHAHNYAARMKLHLGTGELFDNNRKSKGNIGSKKLAIIRAELEDAKIPLPPQ